MTRDSIQVTLPQTLFANENKYYEVTIEVTAADSDPVEDPTMDLDYSVSEYSDSEYSDYDMKSK